MHSEPVPAPAPDLAPEPVLLTIGAVAERTGLPVKLIRHWSDLGIAPPADRTEAGYRRYGPEAVARLDLARTLRDLGLGLSTIRDVLDRERDLPEVAAVHADALEARIRTLRLRQAVLRSVARRGADAAELTALDELVRMSAAEREAIVGAFVAEALGDVGTSSFGRGLLAAMPELPADPTAEQVDAWCELSALVRDPALAAALRRMAEYAARYAPADASTAHAPTAGNGAEDGHGTGTGTGAGAGSQAQNGSQDGDGSQAEDRSQAEAAERLTDAWVRRVSAAMDGGLAPDSPAADAVVTAVVAEWLPLQSGTPGAPDRDGPAARARLLEQLEMAADARAERYWQLVCVINGLPVRPSLAPAGAWLITALRTNPTPGARATALEALYDGDAAPGAPEPPGTGLVDAFASVLAEVERLVTAVGPDRFGDPTPCADWDVRALLDHLVWENLIWAGLAEGSPPTDHGADHLGADPLAAFRAAASATMTAFRRPGMLERRYGPAPGRRLVEQLLIEMLVHGWDLAMATGQRPGFAEETVEAVLPSVREIYGALPRTPGGSFAPEAPVPDGSSATDRLAAFLGRRVVRTP
ncbi:TIGR03086 family metal-binding protein [Streptomyces sp. NPDC060131]|uniref:TIGR03086 family metal-binding protein n=1 Tax=unclassified Streptomyces TaxID=2593676 RepID=UPI0036568C31